MIILALDSATSQCSLALWRDATILAARHVATGGQGDALPLEVEALLADAGLGLAAVDRLAVTIGPGRFTGLRAGLAFMRGLALARALPIVGVTTLAAIVAPCAVARDEIQLAVMNSKRVELFFQLFDADDGALSEPFAATPDSLPAHLPPATRVVVIGERAVEVTAVPRRVAPRVPSPAAVEAGDVARSRRCGRRPGRRPRSTSALPPRPRRAALAQRRRRRERPAASADGGRSPMPSGWRFFTPHVSPIAGRPRR